MYVALTLLTIPTTNAIKILIASSSFLIISWKDSMNTKHHCFGTTLNRLLPSHLALNEMLDKCLSSILYIICHFLSKYTMDINFSLAPHTFMCYNTKELKIIQKDATIKQDGCSEINKLFWLSKSNRYSIGSGRLLFCFLYISTEHISCATA